MVPYMYINYTGSLPYIEMFLHLPRGLLLDAGGSTCASAGFGDPLLEECSLSSSSCRRVAAGHRY